MGIKAELIRPNQTVLRLQLVMPPRTMTMNEPDRDFEVALKAARGGDAPAREVLYERLYPRVERLVHHGLSRDVRRGRPWLATRFSTGDVVQEVFRHLLTDFQNFAGESEEAFVGYLATSVRHRLVDAVRFHEAAQRDGRRTTPPPEGHDPSTTLHSPISDLASAEEVAAFHEALETFPERDRFLLRARIEQDARFQDLADQLGYSSKSAARRAFYAAQAVLIVRLRQRTTRDD